MIIIGKQEELKRIWNILVEGDVCLYSENCLKKSNAKDCDMCIDENIRFISSDNVKEDLLDDYTDKEL